MPIPPRPFNLVCDKCGWKKTVAPLSDALRPGEWFEECPKCRNKKLRMQAPGWLEKAVAEVLRRW
ncbi:hypothetical protein CJF39_09620 [Pseudomonas lundensis]|uniref:Uncharacterized protein n=1 Tax=Pseudomonas lundensis TaxID=86185 RepID=A0A266NBJ4_9PSED|nr:hypothetical protein CJF39_09620 [Pseudomonas lundensis]